MIRSLLQLIDALIMSRLPIRCDGCGRWMFMRHVNYSPAGKLCDRCYFEKYGEVNK